MKGRLFIDRVIADWARTRRAGRIDMKRGKGSHLVLHYGDRKTVVKDRRKEIGPGLLSAMLHQLGLTQRDVR